LMIYPNHTAAQQNRQEPSAAIEALLKAAEEGDATAQFKLANAYYRGRGVRQDYVEAFKWNRKAAEQGDARAQYSLAYMYDKGEGIAQDDVEAMTWYTKAANQDNSAAQFSLGLKYFEGRGVTQDYVKAFDWFGKAADQGDSSAQFRLGRMYADGRGVSQDYIQAYKWFDLCFLRSAPSDRAEVSEWRNTVAKKMTPQQIEEAQRLAKQSGMYFVGNPIVPPVALNRPLPHYTAEARLARVSGTVVLRCLIRKDGSVNRCEIIRGLGYGLDQSAITTITSQWRFKPGTRQGVPVDVQANIEVSFRLPR